MGKDVSEKNLAKELEQRKKELACLYDIEKIYSRSDATIDEICWHIVNRIPDGWQHSNICSVKITLDGKVYAPPGFEQTKWVQMAPITLMDHVAGIISVYYSKEMPRQDEGPFLIEERNLLDTIADRLSRRVLHQRLEGRIAGLNERTKELTCLYNIEQTFNRSEAAIDEICKYIVKAIPPGWQYPDRCTAKITVDGDVFCDDDFIETPWFQMATLSVVGEVVGVIAVYYREKMPDADEGPFLKEERTLLNTIAERLSRRIHHNRLQSQLRNLNERSKELRCLYHIEQKFNTDAGLPEICNHIVRSIPPGWQFPKETQARIQIREDVYQGQEFKDTPWYQSAGLFLLDEKIGEIKVHYTEEKPSADEGPFLIEERTLLETISERLSRRILHEHLKSHLNSLQERSKELNCLYRVEQALRQTDAGIDVICREIVSAIPSGWQYPENCLAKISLEGAVYQSPGFCETPWVQISEISVLEETVGIIAVYYTEEKPEADEGPFLNEERTLIDAISKRLSHRLLHHHLKRKIENKVTQIRKEDDGWLVLDLLKNSGPTKDQFRWRLHMASRLATRLSKTRFGVEKAYLIGSVENGMSGPGSDIDLVFHFRGTEQQKLDLQMWLEGWSLCLSDLNFLRTGKTTHGLLDVHYVSDEDIASQSSYAVRIANAPCDAMELDLAD